ncbi:serine/threonine-protein kinase [Nonomuraea sp. NPDC048881]|uniref:serine/threonine-protein kinase n=1 Tax=Nonomuraea sp. NPDC048881 TaxID=3155030 RepID=UPI0033FE01DE
MPETHPLQPGDPRSLGAYRLLERLGKGAQGVVFKAAGPDGRLVAIKLLNTLLDRPGLDGERFLREVAAARRVAQFCTAQVLGANLDGEQPYIVSELVDGVSLQVVVQREGPRQGGALYRLAVGTVTALAAIHRAGIVHRDFKPSNVLLGPDGPRVIDFGIARALDSAMTISSGVVGTPAYMSPEQISGERVGPAGDMFSWALTMLYAATGRPAFGQDSLPAVIYRVMNEEPDLSALPGELRPLVQACLSKRAEDRPTAADALFALLENQGAAAQRDAEVALNTGSQLAADHPHPAADGPGPSVPPPSGPLPSGSRPSGAGPSGPAPAGGVRDPGPVGARGPQGAPAPTGWANPSGASYTPPPPAARPAVQGPPAAGGAGRGPAGPGAPSRGPGAGGAGGGPPGPGAPFGGAGAGGGAAGPGAPFGGAGAGGGQEGVTRYVRQAPAGPYGQPPRFPPPYPMGSRQAPAGSGNDAFFRHAPAVEPPGEVRARRRRAIMVSSALAVALALAGGVLFLGPRMFGPENPPSPGAAAEATTSLAPSPALPTARPTATLPATATPPSTPVPSPTVTPVPTQTVPPPQAVAAIGKQDGKSLKGHTKGVQTVSALSLGDGRTWLVSGGQDGRVRLWDLGRHKPLATMRGHSEEVYAVAAVMMGKTPMAVSGGYDGSVRLWNLKTHKGKVLGWHGDAVYSVALTKAGGKWIAVTGDANGWLRFWDLKRRKATGRAVKAHRTSVNWLNATHLGDRAIVVSAGEDATLRLWDVARHKPYGKAYKGHAKGVYAVATGRLGDRTVVASGGKDRKIRIWDPKTGKTIGSPLSGHKKIIYSLSFGTLGGRPVLLSGSTDGTIRLWDPDTHKPLGKPVKAHKRGVYAVGIVPSDGGPVVVSAGKDKVIRVWKPKEEAGS